MTRDEAIAYGESKNARIQEKLHRAGSSYGDYAIYYSEMAFTSAALAALREQEERRWIPVTERLPDDGETVLTYKNGRVEVQMYEKMRNGWINGNWFWSMATVTYWTPIPESMPKPPKEA